jgi:hypothetical protein
VGAFEATGDSAAKAAAEARHSIMAVVAIVLPKLMIDYSSGFPASDGFDSIIRAQ